MYKLMNKTPKSYNGEIVSTVIDIKQDEPYTIVSREIDGDHSNASDKRSIELVLELLNEETTPRNEMKLNLKNVENKLSEAMDSIEAQQKTANVLAGTVEELIALFYEEVVPKEEVPVEEELPTVEEGVVE